MKTLPQIFAERGDSWVNHEEPEQKPETNACWEVTLASTGQILKVFDRETADRYRQQPKLFTVRQVSSYSRPYQEVEYPDMDQWTEATRQKKRSPLVSRFRPITPQSRRDSRLLKATQVMSGIRVGKPVSHNKYRVTWADGRYFEVFWTLEEAEEKRQVLAKYLGFESVITVEEQHR